MASKNMERMVKAVYPLVKAAHPLVKTIHPWEEALKSGKNT